MAPKREHSGKFKVYNHRDQEWIIDNFHLYVHLAANSPQHEEPGVCYYTAKENYRDIANIELVLPNADGTFTVPPPLGVQNKCPTCHGPITRPSNTK